MGTILKRYRQLHPRSAALHAEALRFFPNGVTHDVRYSTPFPIYVEHAAGSRKWDVDGHEIIDYVMGHGALLLGHAHPEVTRVAAAQLQKGTHYGACQEMEMRWASWVERLVPSAEVVRFTSSGTEATMMAARLARAFTGREKLVRFNGHFHGWSDSVAGYALASEVAPEAVGIPTGTLQSQVLVPQHDIEALRRVLERGEAAAVILEPTGAHYGAVPMDPAFLADVRELTEKAGALLIFDEVVTGFRVAPGGAQALFGVLPDITCLAKVLAGGLPGGAVTGRGEVLSLLDFRDNEWNLKRRISHPGTFNANPLSAAAGSTCLSLIADGRAQERAAELCRRLCRGMNGSLRRAEVPGCAYGFSSMFHITMGHEVPPPDDDFLWRWEDNRPGPTVPGMARELLDALKRGMLNRGVDLMRNGGLVSAVHSEEDVEATLAAFEETLADMRREELV